MLTDLMSRHGSVTGLVTAVAWVPHRPTNYLAASETLLENTHKDDGWIKDDKHVITA